VLSIFSFPSSDAQTICYCCCFCCCCCFLCVCVCVCVCIFLYYSLSKIILLSCVTIYFCKASLLFYTSTPMILCHRIFFVDASLSHSLSLSLSPPYIFNTTCIFDYFGTRGYTSQGDEDQASLFILKVFIKLYSIAFVSQSPIVIIPYFYESKHLINVPIGTLTI
jgi:hypothetical protein